MAVPALRYLSAEALDRCLPPVEQQLELAARALSALGTGEAEMPPKIGVHPRPGALLHAMPAWLRSDDLVGLKWVSAFPGNRARDLAAINGLVVLNDPETGLPTWIMDAARITAVRTAAVSGVGIRLFLPPRVDKVAILGAGVQAASHVDMLHDLLPESEILVFDRHPERAGQVAARAASVDQRASVAASAEEAVAAAQVVITVASLGGASQLMGPQWLTPGTVVIAVDFATFASAELARAVDRFVVDDREQFMAYRDAGYFEGYPDPTATMGEELERSAGHAELVPQRPASAGATLPALVTHLGVGLADVLFADAIRQRAESAGAGTELRR